MLVPAMQEEKPASVSELRARAAARLGTSPDALELHRLEPVPLNDDESMIDMLCDTVCIKIKHSSLTLAEVERLASTVASSNNNATHEANAGVSEASSCSFGSVDAPSSNGDAAVLHAHAYSSSADADATHVRPSALSRIERLRYVSFCVFMHVDHTCISPLLAALAAMY